jgi:hypothetical protein
MYIHETNIPYSFDFPISALKMQLRKNRIPYADLVRQQRGGKYFLDVVFRCADKETFLLGCLAGELDIKLFRDVIQPFENRKVNQIAK